MNNLMVLMLYEVIPIPNHFLMLAQYFVLRFININKSLKKSEAPHYV